MNLKKIKVGWLVSSLIVSGIGHAEEVDQDLTAYNTPYINPARDCISDGMTNPHGKEFRYLYSKDCRIVYVLPPATRPQSIKTQGLNLGYCVDMEKVRKNISRNQDLLDQGTLIQEKYETALSGDISKQQEERLENKLKNLKLRLEGYREVIRKDENYFDEVYGKMPGARVSIAVDGSVTQSELNAIRGLNKANLERRIEKQIIRKDANGNDVVEKSTDYIISSLRAPQVGLSLFSFNYLKPKDAIKGATIVSSEFPGLEYLEQKNSNMGIVHVKANGGISGALEMSLQYGCDNSELDQAGVRTLKKFDPFFSVNQTFEVQQMFAQGYTASLKVDKVVEQISKYVTTAKEHNFVKSVLFEPQINANIDEILNFQWETEYQAGGNISMEEIQAIQASVAAKFIDDYIDDLVKVGVLTIEPDKVVPPAEGGTVDVTKVANRCWSERKGGIGGLFGGRRTVCGDFTYVVKEWKDGETTNSLNRKLTLEGTKSERVVINQMVPFYFTTAFSNANSNINSNEEGAK